MTQSQPLLSSRPPESRGRYRLPPGTPSRVTSPNDRLGWKTKFLQFALGTRTDPKPSQEQLEQFLGFLQAGDPLADAVVAWMHATGVRQGRALVARASETGIASIPDAPEPLRAFFEQVERVPLWVDREKLDLACDVHRRTGPMAELVLRNVALMGGYVAAAATKPLAFTAQLDKSTARRLVETGKYWVEVTRRGGLYPHRDGWQTSVHVRLMHAQVRYMLNRSEKWDREAWGEPLNQADTVATNLLFSYIFMHSLRALGFRFTGEEREAVIHLWRYAGYLMGIDERLLPACEDDAARIAFMNFLTLAEPDDDSRRLAQALLDVSWDFAEKTPWIPRWATRIEYHYRAGFSRLILGRETSDRLGLPDTAMKFGVLATAPLIWSLEGLRQRIPGATKLAVYAGGLLHERGLQAAIEAHRADTTFTPVKTLAR
ncbi:MAG: oxygenase MpaB family protein [Pseudomonadota bacterium]